MYHLLAYLVAQEKALSALMQTRLICSQMYHCMVWYAISCRHLCTEY